MNLKLIAGTVLLAASTLTTPALAQAPANAEYYVFNEIMSMKVGSPGTELEFAL